MIKIAIDSGKSGALVYSNGGVVKAIKCPDTQVDMCNLIKDIKLESEDCEAIIEKVHSMPKQGVVSVWKFSANYATWQTSLIMADIPFEEVTPQKWMKLLGDLPKDKKERKNRIKDKMQKKFPDLKVTLATSDALAIWHVFFNNKDKNET